MMADRPYNQDYVIVYLAKSTLGWFEVQFQMPMAAVCPPTLDNRKSLALEGKGRQLTRGRAEILLLESSVKAISSPLPESG